MRIYVERTYDVKTVAVSLPPTIYAGNLKINMVAYIDGKPIYVYILPNKYI